MVTDTPLVGAPVGDSPPYVGATLLDTPGGEDSLAIVAVNVSGLEIEVTEIDGPE